MKQNLINVILILAFFTGCSNTQTINLQPHSYSTKPQKIIWLQIAGLSEEHLALIRFQSESIDKKTSFETSTCLGKSWDYNLFKIRPTPISGFMSQLTGKMNVTGSCEDYALKPVWTSLTKAGYHNYILETDRMIEGQSMVPGSKCSEKSFEFIRDASVLVMDKKPIETNASSFHFQSTNLSFEPAQIYYDQSCNANGCFASVSRNVEMLYNYTTKTRGNSFILIRDFSYYNSLKANRLDQATERLIEYEKIVDQFIQIAKKEKDLLLIVSSSSPVMFEFPPQGQDWDSFILTGKNIFWKQNSLISPVFAFGASSENFCGVYDSSDMFKRLLWSPKMGRLPLNFFDLF